MNTSTLTIRLPGEKREALVRAALGRPRGVPCVGDQFFPFAFT